jgi:hypothetical protein
LAADELVRRYCGLTGETWAYPFFDGVPASPEVDRVDLLAAGVMHGPIRQVDLEWFVQARSDIQALVKELPQDHELADVGAGAVSALTAGVAQLAGGRPLSLLTKILHRHRPHLVVLDERDIGRRYGSALEGRGRLDYPRLVTAVREDLRRADVAEALDRIRETLSGLHPLPSRLRVLDIAVWMDARR